MEKQTIMVMENGKQTGTNVCKEVDQQSEV